jgi:hypothetical protein
LSARRLYAVPVNLDRSTEERCHAFGKTEADTSIISRLPFEAIYQLYFAPDPTPEQVAMEMFLLECD